MATRPSDSELEHLRAAVAAPGRRTMARSEVHGWNRRWSGNDTDILDRHLQRTGVARFSRTADDRYIRDSILLPRSQVVAGFMPIMPSFQGQLSESDVLALIAYLKSTSSAPTQPPSAGSQSTTQERARPFRSTLPGSR